MLLADEPDWAGGYGSLVPVSWAAPDGVRHRGQFLAAPGARAGTRVTVWTDASGHLTATPMSPRQAVTQADLAAAIAVPVWALTLLCAGMACRHMLDRRRLAAWEAEWRTLNFSGPAGASPDRRFLAGGQPRSDQTGQGRTPGCWCRSYRSSHSASLGQRRTVSRASG